MIPSIKRTGAARRSRSAALSRRFAWLLAIALLGAAVVVACERDASTPLWKTAECRSCAGAELLQCTDDLDNDGDGKTDCDDEDCLAAPECSRAPDDKEDSADECANGKDDDGNGYTDCADFGCQPTSACTPEIKEPENTALKCLDGLDNDGDGDFDCKDADCSSRTDVCESSDAACSDGLDNDENGFIDCLDFGCSRSDTVTVCAP